MKTFWRNKVLPAGAGAGFLLLLSALAGWPVLSGGGLWYLDNPAHLAETVERAQPGWQGWSDLAFCGFPLGQWHSPLAYGALARAVQWGAPLASAYAAALWAACLFPPLMLFFGARSRLGTPRAALLAAILLLQPPALVGIESAWGGMWTFYLAAGALLVLMQRWSADRGSLTGDAAWIGFIGLTHLFVFAMVALLAAMRMLFSFRAKTAWRVFGACALGALAAAAFWLPAGWAQAGADWIPQNLPAGRLLWALAVPSNLQILTSAAQIDWREALQPGLLPMLALVGLGITGGFRRTASTKSPSHRFGLSFALALLTVLLLLPVLPAGLDRICGPVSWRLLYLVRLGLAWSAVGALAPANAAPTANKAAAGRWALAGLLILALGWTLAAPLRRAVRDPGQETRREIHKLWDAIRTTSIPTDAGRIYLQDTYQNPASPDGLARNSHVLAFTAAATGARQVGAYYGMAPQPTAEWTSAEFGRLCGVAPGDPDAIATVLERLRRAHCSRLVTASPFWTGMLEQQPGVAKQYESEWFTLFRLESPEPPVQTTQIHPGEAIVVLTTTHPEDLPLLAQSWHPDWELDAPRDARLVPDDSGLCRVEDLPPGVHTLHLRYQPPSWPRWISWVVWTGLAWPSGRKRIHPLFDRGANAA